MANLIPSYDKILSLKVKPEEGELHLLKFLDTELDDRPHFEVLGAKYKNNAPDSEEEIWIPIQEKRT